VDSEEIFVYFRNRSDSGEKGYDLYITRLQAIEGTHGFNDLGFPGPAYPADEIFLWVSTPDGQNTLILPDARQSDGYLFAHTADRVVLNVLLRSQPGGAADQAHFPMIRLWESDDARSIGAALFAHASIISSAS